MGDKEYEKTVTGQFIEAIPGDLEALEKAWQNKDVTALHRVAHNLKTTVSVMGLNEILQPNLDAMEYETLTEESFNQNMSSVNLICTTALTEAQNLYSSF